MKEGLILVLCGRESADPFDPCKGARPSSSFFVYDFVTSPSWAGALS